MLRIGSTGAEPLGALIHLLGPVGGGGRGHARRRSLRLADNHGICILIRWAALDGAAVVRDRDGGGGGEQEEADAEAQD